MIKPRHIGYFHIQGRHRWTNIPPEARPEYAEEASMTNLNPAKLMRQTVWRGGIRLGEHSVERREEKTAGVARQWAAVSKLALDFSTLPVKSERQGA